MYLPNFRVKCYAPHVIHVVADIYCGAIPISNDVGSVSSMDDPTSSVPQALKSSVAEPCLSTAPLSSWAGGQVQIVHNPSIETFWKDIFPQAQPVILRGLDFGSSGDFSTRLIHTLNIFKKFT